MHAPAFNKERWVSMVSSDSARMEAGFGYVFLAECRNAKLSKRTGFLDE